MQNSRDFNREIRDEYVKLKHSLKQSLRDIICKLLMNM